MATPMQTPYTEQLACVERELALREKVYPRWVRDNRMPKSSADREIRAMRAVVETLRGLCQRERLL
jgi:hypothetical protein